MPGTVRVTVLETLDLPGTGGKKYYVKVSIGDRSFSTKPHSSSASSGSVSIKPFNSDHSFPVLNLTDPLVITLIDLRTETPVGRAVIPVPSIVEKGIRDEIIALSNGGRIRVKSSFSLSEEEKKKLAQMRINSLKKKQLASKSQKGSTPDAPPSQSSPALSSNPPLPPNLTPSAIPKPPTPQPISVSSPEPPAILPPEPVLPEPVLPVPPKPVLPEPVLPKPVFEFKAGSGSLDSTEPVSEPVREVTGMEGVEYVKEEDPAIAIRREESDKKKDEYIAELKKMLERRKLIGKIIAPDSSPLVARTVGKAVEKFMASLNRLPSYNEKRNIKHERRSSFIFNKGSKEDQSQSQNEVVIQKEVESQTEGDVDLPPHGFKRARSFIPTAELDSALAPEPKSEPKPEPKPETKKKTKAESKPKPESITPRSIELKPTPVSVPEPKLPPPPESVIEASVESEGEYEENEYEENEKVKNPKANGGFFRQVIGGLIVAVAVAILWPKKRVYIVKKGDHLCGLLPKEYYKPHSRFYKLNPNVRDADHIYEGQEIVLP